MSHSPAVRPEHLASAQLFADRQHMVVSLKEHLPPNPYVCEIGVALGDFSEFLLKTLEPREFVALDLFDLHELESLWGRPTSEIFGGRLHAQYYRDRFAGHSVRTMAGDSAEGLAMLPDACLDLVYIDGDHSYEGALADTEQALRKVKPTGILIFNDYIMYDHIQMGAYGVVPVVNELVNRSDWKIVGLALNPAMFCDIALRRCVAQEQA